MKVEMPARAALRRQNANMLACMHGRWQERFEDGSCRAVQSALRASDASAVRCVCLFVGVRAGARVRLCVFVCACAHASRSTRSLASGCCVRRAAARRLAACITPCSMLIPCSTHHCTAHLWAKCFPCTLHFRTRALLCQSIGAHSAAAAAPVLASNCALLLRYAAGAGACLCPPPPPLGSPNRITPRRAVLLL